MFPHRITPVAATRPVTASGLLTAPRRPATIFCRLEATLNSRIPNILLGLLTLAAVIAGTALVVMRAQPASAPASAPAAPQAASAVVAQIDGETITEAEVDRAVGMQLDRLNQQVYELRQQGLDRLLSQRLLAREAAKRGMSVEDLLRAEVGSKVVPVTTQQVDEFYEANKARLPDRPDIKDQVKRFLEQQRGEEAAKAYVESLRKTANVVVSLAPPPVVRYDVSSRGPSRGPASAPVTIVEFSDFHCPFCRRVQPVLSELLARYPTQVRLVYRDLPLDSLHPQARRAAEAARCANDQEKFWPFHDALYERGPDASTETLRAAATAVGLDLAAFEQCLGSGKHREAVQEDVEEAQSLGAEGTPAFFINGRFLSGAQPLETFVKVIDEELAGK